MATATATANRRQQDGMSQFTWVGTDKRGKKLKGEQLAKNANLVKAELRKQGINPITVAEKRKPLFGGAGKAISGQDIAFFSRQLATMMASGVPLVQSFEIIASGTANPRFKTLLSQIKSSIEGGSSLYEALSEHPVIFDELYRNLVRAGESAGVLDTVLDTIASYKENIEAIKGKIKKALFYPTAVIIVALIVSAVLLLYVVPQFQELFRGFGADLPAFTMFLINISEWTQSYWYILLGAIVGTISTFLYFKRRSLAFAHFLDRVVLKIPVIGKILQDAAIARFSRTLAITFRAGVPLVEALDAVAGATGNSVYTKAVLAVKEDVSVGHQLQLAMRQTGVFPQMVVSMTAIGEESGNLDTMLTKVAEYYEMEVNNAVDALSSLMEPFIMVVIGTLVGGMVIGMYLPIFKLAAVV